jgi:hypothetical protein
LTRTGSTISGSSARWHPSLDNPRETHLFDILTRSSTHFFINETWNPARMSDAEGFVALVRQLPEHYRHMERYVAVPILASFHTDPAILAYLTEHGIYCLDMKMDQAAFDADLADFDEASAVHSRIASAPVG